MKNILTVIGARPQFIKAASISRQVEMTDGLNEVLLHTGQHFDSNMSDIFFEELELPVPDMNLGVSSASHGAMTGDMLKKLETVMLDQRPDMVVVYGDTNSTLAGALAAAKLNIPIAHVEAGLRSFNRLMPEEINRVLTDHCSDILFAPTDTASVNLRNEGISADKVIQCGDVMYDSAIYYGKLAERRGLRVESYGVTSESYVLATVHRQENTDQPERLRNILLGLQGVARTMPVIFPMHPRTEKAIKSAEIEHLLEGITTTKPLGFLEMLVLEKYAAVVATDSGGVQKEAFFHSVPCVTLRDETEWIELVESGWNTLVPPNTTSRAICEAILSSVGSAGEPCAPYGDGHASKAIVDKIRDWIG